MILAYVFPVSLIRTEERFVSIDRIGQSPILFISCLKEFALPYEGEQHG
jgi:hypothetical protein